MPNFREYNAKLQSTSGMRRVTSTMKMVSSSHLRRAQKSLRQPVEFAERLAPLIGMVRHRASLRRNRFLAEPPAENPRILLVVIGSDRGLCGAFNSVLVRAAEEWTQKARADRGADVRAVYVGQKPYAALRKTIPTKFNLVSVDSHPMLRHTHVLASYALHQFLDGAVTEIWVLFNRFVSTMKYEPEALRVLPMSDEAVVRFTGGASQKLQMPEKPSLEPGYRALLETVVRHWIDLAFFVAEAHSSASEHSARMIAMDSATRNLDRISRKLLLLRNRARQAAITKELTEIVGGAESLAQM